jgi:hypothetical protein
MPRIRQKALWTSFSRKSKILSKLRKKSRKRRHLIVPLIKKLM